MIDLSKIINNNGNPKAIIDYSGRPKDIVFDFDETIYMDHDKNIFVNNKKVDGDPIEIWQSCINSWKQSKNSEEIAAVGFFSYDFKDILFPNYPFKSNLNNNFPYFWFGRPSKLVQLEDYRYDYKKQKINFKKSLIDIKDFEKVIRKIKEHLYNGDVYQINFTQPIIFDYNGNYFDLYMQIKDNANPDFGFFLDINEYKILSFSPEKFFTKNNGLIKSYPIKGTIKRLNDLEEDLNQIQILKNSEKDKAEHLMIVDLLRNDIGKIAKFNSVKVKDLFSIKTFKTIHHMESEIVGKSSKEITESDIIKALFPGGSITGAPKYRATQIIDHLEDYNRGIYTGCLGTIMGNGDMDFNICIRTATLNDNTATYPVGGGIVWDSISESEYNEAQEKANILD